MLETKIEESSIESVGDSAVFYDRTGPGTPCGRYLRQFWTPVALLDDVRPGRAKKVHMMGEVFTYYRGETGTPHLVANECAHRHTTLAPHGIVEDDCIRCFYHGWKYDAGGQCLEQPAEGAQSFAHKVRIKAYPVREDMGIVFAFLGTGDPPEFAQIDVFHGPGVRDISTYERNTNFFNAVDNQADWVHVYFVHARGAFTSFGENPKIPSVSAEETGYGLIGRLTHADGKIEKYHVLMPTCMYLCIYMFDVLVHHFAWRVPIDDNSYRSFNVTYADVTGEAAEQYLAARKASRERAQSLGKPSSEEMMKKIVRGEIHINEVDVDHPDLVGLQDSVTMENQRLISEREPDRLGHSDAGLIVLRKIYRREVRKLLAGEPLKTWKWPQDLMVDTGF